MRHAAALVTSAAIVGLLLVACRDEFVAPKPNTPTPAVASVAPQLATANQDFFFLPPVAPNPRGTTGFDEGQFDGTLTPTVELCALDGAECAAVQPAGFPLVFTTDGSGPAKLRVDVADESYSVNWQTKRPTVSSALNYRIHVRVAGTVLGFLDVDVTDSGAEKKSSGDARVVTVVNGSTLPIKFRIEHGAVFVVGSSGGVVSAQEGRVTLTIPARSDPIGVTVAPGTEVPSDARLLAGTAFDLGPAGSFFDPPATLSIKYDPATLPSGKYPRMHKVVNGAWSPIPGSTHDQINHVVSAPVSGFSTWGVLGTGLDLTVHVSGGVGDVRVESDAPPDPCTYQESPCTRNEAAGTALELVATPLTPDARFEAWTGTGTGFSCTTNPRCQLVMDQDREVTARFSMPGIVAVDRSAATFAMIRGGALPAVQTASITNAGGRALTLAPVSATYAPQVTAWLDVQVDRSTIDPAGPAGTLTMSVKPNTLFPGTYTARIVVRDDGSLTLRFVDVTITVASAGPVVAVNGTGRRFGPLPIVTYALVDNASDDIYPLGPDNRAFFLFGLFDTGTSSVYLNSEYPYGFVLFPEYKPDGGLICHLPNKITDGNFFGADASHLSVTVQQTARVRLNGLAALTAALQAPIGAGAAQVEVSDITVIPAADPSLDVTLIGMSVATKVVTALDYTQSVTKAGFDFYQGLTTAANSGIPGFTKRTAVTAPHITFHPAGSSVLPAGAFELDLGRTTLPERFILTNVAFRHQGGYVSDADPVAAPGAPFLYDTGTDITIINDQIASQLHLVAGGGSFSCLGGTNNGFVLDEVMAVGSAGTYVVTNVSVCWRQSAILGIVTFSAVIGSNLFDQVRIVLDGPRNKLGVGPVASSPISWQSPPRNCTTSGGTVVVSLAVSIADPTLTPGQQTQASAVATDNLGSTFALPAIWSSSNSAIASVSANGVVTAVGPGIAVIVGRAAGLSAAAQVTVGTNEGSRQPNY